MKTNMINKTHIEGALYECTLEERQAGPNAQNPGAKYISGDINIQVQEGNVIKVNIFESEMTKAGTVNKKYGTLLRLIESPTVLDNPTGATVTYVRMDSAFANNDWYDTNSSTHIHSIRQMNGFLHIITADQSKNEATFEVDMLITNTREEVKKDSNGDELPTGNVYVDGYVFDFRGGIIPIYFLTEKEEASNYFRGLEPNTFTKISGKMISSTIVTTKVEPSAFGDDKEVQFTKTLKQNVVTHASAEVYPFGDENFLTPDEVKTALANRELALTTIKTNTETRANTPKTTPVASGTTTQAGSFSF